MRFFGKRPEGLLKGAQCDAWGEAVVKEDLLVCMSAGLWDWQGEDCVLEGLWLFALEHISRHDIKNTDSIHQYNNESIDSFMLAQT